MSKILPFKKAAKKAQRRHAVALWRKALWKRQMPPFKDSKVYIGRMLPNFVTLLALCMGLTSIHFAFLAQWEYAAASVLLAGVLDGIDGRLARFIGHSTDFGAELDSLSDFISFGVSPALLVFFFALHQWDKVGWGMCLFFSSCMALRLARFNTQRSRPSSRNPVFSVGLPAPAGAFLVLLPMMAQFIWHKPIPPWFFCGVLSGVSFLMVSHFPTFLVNRLVIRPAYKPAAMLLFLLFVIGLLTMPWETLLLCGFLYTLSLPLSGYLFYAKKTTKSLAF